MAQQEAGVRILAGAMTIVALVAIWLGIVTSLPSQQELLAGNSQGAASTVATAPRVAASQAKSSSDQAVAQTEPTLDLTIPGTAPVTSPAQREGTVRSNEGNPSMPPVIDARSAQVVRLKCEAEIEQLCPDTGDGTGRARCFERKSAQLTVPCREQFHERFVKWKEDRSRMLSACQDDVKRLCVGIRPGDGRVVQCLQEHSQDVSERCYQTLPKGALLFRQ